MIACINKKRSPLRPEYISDLLGQRCRVLDIGCGSGCLCSSLNEAGFDCIGVDKNADGKLYVRGCAEKLPFDDESFDAVVMECTFSLCESSSAKEVIRVLKKGGYFVLSDFFIDGESLQLTSCNTLRNVYSGTDIVGFFSSLSLEMFEDRTEDMLSFAAEMLMSADDEKSKELLSLAALKPKYAVWKFRK